MRKVIMISEEPKGVEFTHEFMINKCISTYDKPSDFEKIVYLGKCDTDGDMFAAYACDCVCIYKGNLNNGTY